MWAIRRSADSGSPWEPVEITTTLWSGQSSTSLGLDQHPVGDLDVAERAADVDVLAHRAADQRDLAPERGGGVDDLLHAVDVGREARDDDPALGAREHLLAGAGRRRARTGEKPGRSALVESPHSSSTPVAPELGQPRDVGGQPVDRGLVELVVAGEQHRPELGA